MKPIGMMAAALGAASGLLAGCAGPLERPTVRLNDQVTRVEDAIKREWHWNASAPEDGATTPAMDRVVALPVLDADSDLDDFLVYAALNNPTLEAAFARWKASLERLPQVRALPDPRFTYGIFINEVETRVGPQQHRIAIAQTFPWFGKLDLREGLAARQAEAAYQAYLGERLVVAQSVRDACFELAGLENEIRISRENIELLSQIEGSARATLRGGTGNHPDVIRLQIEMEKLRDQLRTLEDARHPINARLNAALNRPIDRPLPAPGMIDLPHHSLNADDDTITKLLQRNNPRLKAMQHTIEGGRVATQLARRAEQPDVTLGLDYIATDDAANSSLSESGDDPLVASVSFNVPIWHEKYEAGVREAIANRYANIRQQEALLNDLQSQVQRTLFDYRTAERQITLYRDTLLPKAIQSLEATLGGYRTGMSSFLDLLEAQRELLEFELMHIRAQTSRARHLARLDLLAGIDLPRSADDVKGQEASES